MIERSGPLCFVFALGIAFGTVFALGYIDDRMGGLLGALLPLCILLWLGFAVFEVRHRRFRWLLASLPFVLGPVWLFGLIFEACSRGDCL